MIRTFERGKVEITAARAKQIGDMFAEIADGHGGINLSGGSERFVKYDELAELCLTFSDILTRIHHERNRLMSYFTPSCNNCGVRCAKILSFEPGVDFRTKHCQDWKDNGESRATAIEIRKLDELLNGKGK